MKVSIRMVILGFALIPMIISVIIVTSFSISNTLSSGRSRVESYKSELLANKKEMLKYNVDIAISSIQKYHKGGDSDSSKADALKMVKVLRYGKSGYFWINDFYPNMIMHPFAPALEGKSLRENKDPNGVYLFREFVKVCEENGEGFVFYSWPKPGFDKPQPKLSYVKAFKHWGWIIGSGVYIDDIDQRMKEVQDEIQSEVNSMIIQSIVIGALLCILIGILAIFIVTKGLYSRIMRLIQAVVNIENTADFSQRIEILKDDEIGQTGMALNNVLTDLQSSIVSISEVMNAISTGDLSKHVKGTPKGDLLVLKRSINQSVDLLKRTVKDVTEICAQVYNGAHDISSSSASLASGTVQQAAALEEIGASINDVSSQAKISAENASESRKLSRDTVETVKEGNVQMKTLLESMHRINETTTEVSKIIKAIDEIAFQTNLLSLNAAVEAARAGKYGKGFAVVAEEVRSLANRSATSAKETTELIENAVREVRNGVNNANKTAGILGTIIEGVENVNKLTMDASESSQNQSMAIEAINTGLDQVNLVVQKNSAISEETASASEELSTRANQLQSMMDQFNVSESTGEPVNPQLSSSKLIIGGAQQKFLE